MPHFFVDDSFHDSKEVMSIPARYRNAAVGLWTRCGAWSAGKLTDGEVGMDTVESFGGSATQKLIHHLVAATLWEAYSDRIVFRNWDKWQRTRAQVLAYRAAQSEKKRKQREAAASKNADMSPGDNLGDEKSCPPGIPQTPIPIPIPKYLSGTESGEGTAGKPPPDDSLEAVSATPGADLVRRIIPNEHPAAVRTMLRVRASELIGSGTPTETVADALRLWLTKPSLGPNVLPSLVSEVIKSRDRPSARPSTSDAAFAATQALKNKPAGRLEITP